jgi:AGCS family alanine or glycine:cation symporter
MWVTGLVGMATKYAEAVLAVKCRMTDKLGNMFGGPMYYLTVGLGWRWLGVLFAVFATVAAFGIGNMVQSNSIADAAHATFNVPVVATGLVLLVAVALVIAGGIKSIGRGTAVLVPVMIVAYVAGALVILLLNLSAIPAALGLIVREAFTPTAAQTRHPVSQTLVSMTQTFIDTIIACTMTELVLILTGAWNNGMTGAALTSFAFQGGVAGGQYVVTIGVILFAYSTILS